MSDVDNCNEEKNFVEFRRKVRAAEVLSASLQHLVKSLSFSGRISVVVQNGRVLKSGYEEGFFSSTRDRVRGTGSGDRTINGSGQAGCWTCPTREGKSKSTIK